VHEILHGIWNVAALDNVIPGEENMVTALSHALYQVMGDNPSLMAFLAPTRH
jgi:hypothetical protein